MQCIVVPFIRKHTTFVWKLSSVCTTYRVQPTVTSLSTTLAAAHFSTRYITHSNYSTNCLCNVFTARYHLRAIMDEASIAEEIKKLQESQKVVADKVRALKKNKAPEKEISDAVQELQSIKAKVEEKMKILKPDKVEFPRAAFQRLMTQRFFFAPSFEIYGGVAGLYDLGPPCTAIKANMLQLWRQHFILTENMLEVDCASVTPETVLHTSGHTAKFADLMVKDVKTGACYRADHLLKAHLEKLLEAKNVDTTRIQEYKSVITEADTYDKFVMHEKLQHYAVKAPDTNNELSMPEHFNLMFQTQIGPTGAYRGFLRPETAQGIFVNFKRLLEFNASKLPFAAAQIGQAYRNEIAPRSGLLRVREFTLAEIEHFVHPEDKKHPKYSSIADVMLTLFPREEQENSKKTVAMSIREAVEKKIINNETLAYFIARTHQFLVSVGVKKDKLRFRQHLKDEMAHYATDCWDAEIQSSYGWVECVGIADRACFDLTAHSTATNQPLSAFIEFPDGPRIEEVLEIVLDKGKIGSQYKSRAQPLIKHLAALPEAEATQLSQALEKEESVTVTVGSESYAVHRNMIKFNRVQKKVSGRQVTPGVIEPSFGIGRILYSVLEHSYYCRESDEQRAVLALPPHIAPVKVSVLPHLNDDKMLAFIPRITEQLTENALSFKVDDTGVSIGRRYARTDEIGIPFAITIDHTTTQDDTVTLRERDSTRQVRIKISELCNVLQQLVKGKLTWEQVFSTYPVVEASKEDQN